MSDESQETIIGIKQKIQSILSKLMSNTQELTGDGNKLTGDDNNLIEKIKKYKVATHLEVLSKKFGNVSES
jgi:hypothetical protein